MPPPDDATYFLELEQGARYLASLSTSDDERLVHLGMANLYSRHALDARDFGKL